MTDALLVLNAGPSSIKFALYRDKAGAPFSILHDKIAGVGYGTVLSARAAEGCSVSRCDLMRLDPAAVHDVLISALIDGLKSHLDGLTIIAAGHRVVHAGRDHTGPAKVTEALLAELDALVPLAPLHQPHNLIAIRCVATSLFGLPQVVRFNTSCHRTQDRLAQRLALPRAQAEADIIRYGFHGLSYDYISGTLPNASWRPSRRTRGSRTSGQWREHVRHERTPQCPYQHGLHRAGGSDHGPALRHNRSRGGTASAGQYGHDVAGSGTPAVRGVRPTWRVTKQRRHGGAAGKRCTGRRARPSSCSATAPPASWQRLAQRSAHSIPSRSRLESARTSHWSAASSVSAFTSSLLSRRHARVTLSEFNKEAQPNE